MIQQEAITKHQRLDNCEDSISRIFLSYLQDNLSEQSYKQMTQTEEYNRIKRYSPQMGWNAFRDLVNLSLEYLSMSINEVLYDFSKYFKTFQYCE